MPNKSDIDSGVSAVQTGKNSNLQMTVEDPLLLQFSKIMGIIIVLVGILGILGDILR